MDVRRVGRYKLLEPIGHGAIGEVYRALDPDLNREVAVKIITRPAAVGSEELQRRFRREVQLAAHLNHLNIISVYDVGLDEKQPYLVTELLAGGTLRDYLDRGALSWQEALALLAPICQALGYAHEAGIIHRDVKPSNIMFANDTARTIKLADFGLAHHLDDDRLTQSGGIVGTIAYMSTEQANGEAVDPRTDIFSLGLILFEAMAGYNPLQGETASRTLLNAISYEAIDLSDIKGKVPVKVFALLDGALARDRKFRYASCQQLGQDMAACLALGRHVTAGKSNTDPAVPAPTAEALSPVQIENAPGLRLPPNGAEILEEMFADYGRISISKELGGGFSGSRVFVVRPIRKDTTPEIPTVVKMAPLRLIEQEWHAYQVHIRDQLSGVTEITGVPVFPLGSSWGGIRYRLVGSGAIEFDSLGQAYHKSSAEDLRFILKDRLFKRLAALWRFNFPTTAFHLAASYDHLLPINLLIRPSEVLDDATIPVIRAGVVGAPELVPGDPVRLAGFVVTEIDEANRIITLDWPLEDGRPPGYYRVRLQPMTDLEGLQVGLMVDNVEGVVTSTRQEMLRSEVLATMGWNFDTDAETISLPSGQTLPNPLLRLPTILAATPTVRLANIHGDLNTENILVDRATRDIRLIDFATARRDHVLHDFLRLESSIVTRLLPSTLEANSLPPEIIRHLYERVHCVTFARSKQISPGLRHDSLVKAYEMLVALRSEATTYLFDPSEWDEYYRGLVVYLLGALKYKNLGETAKQVAFYGAASALHCIETTLPCSEDHGQKVQVVPDPKPADLELASESSQEAVTTFKEQPSPIDRKKMFRPAVPQKESRSTDFSTWLRSNWPLSLLLVAFVVVIFMAVDQLFQGRGQEETSTPTTAVAAATEPPTLTATIRPTNTPVPPTPTPRSSSTSVQTIVPIADGATNVAILLDTSVSMQDEQRLLRVLEGSGAFLNRLQDEDWVSVYKFGDGLLQLSPSGPAGDVREELRQVMDGLFADGETLLYDAICQAAADLAEQHNSNGSETRHNVILLLTDGEDSGIGEITTEDQVFGCLREAWEKTDIQIIALAFGSDVDVDLLERLAQNSRGQLFETTPDSVWTQLTTLSLETRGE